MTQNVFSIQASSFEGFSRTYFKLGTPCPQGKWQVTDRLEALGNNQVMKGEITYNQALDLTLESKIDYDPIRVKMIMDMYFPALNATFKEVEK